MLHWGSTRSLWTLRSSKQFLVFPEQLSMLFNWEETWVLLQFLLFRGSSSWWIFWWDTVGLQLKMRFSSFPCRGRFENRSPALVHWGSNHYCLHFGCFPRLIYRQRGSLIFIQENLSLVCQADCKFLRKDWKDRRRYWHGRLFRPKDIWFSSVP